MGGSVAQRAAPSVIANLPIARTSSFKFRFLRTDVRSTSLECLRESITDLQAQLGGAASNTSEVTQARRRSRRLNGEVTIIRPMSQEPSVVRDEPTQRARNRIRLETRKRKVPTLAGSVSIWKRKVDMRS